MLIFQICFERGDGRRNSEVGAWNASTPEYGWTKNNQLYEGKNESWGVEISIIKFAYGR